jgi:hypothetical protein
LRDAQRCAERLGAQRVWLPPRANLALEDLRALAECDRLVAVLSGSSMASAGLRCLPPRPKARREPHQVGCFARFWCLRALLSPDVYRTGANAGRSRCGQASFSFLSSQVGTSLPPSLSQVCSRWASLTSPDKIADCAIKNLRKSVCLTCPDWNCVK